MPLYYSPPNRSLLKTLNAASSNVNNTETVVLQYLIPAGMWTVGTSIEIDNISLTKSGTTDTMTLRCRVGTAGTTADTAVISSGSIGAANRQFSGSTAMRLESATTALPMAGANGGFNSGTGTSAAPSAVTISSAVSNALYVSITIQSSSTNDTVALTHCRIWLVGKTA